MVNIAIFASGNGSNFEHIVHQIQAGNVENTICKVLIVDYENAKAIERAKKLGISYFYVNPKAFANKEAYETCILEKLKELDIQLIALAGYMRFIGKVLLSAYRNHIINLHPAYLPAFPGAHSIKDAYEAKAEFTGVTVHYVDEGVDTGEIIHQEKIMIDKTWTLEILEKHVHEMEYAMFPMVIDKVVKKIESEETK